AGEVDMPTAARRANDMAPGRQLGQFRRYLRPVDVDDGPAGAGGFDRYVVVGLQPPGGDRRLVGSGVAEPVRRGRALAAGDAGEDWNAGASIGQGRGMPWRYGILDFNIALV